MDKSPGDISINLRPAFEPKQFECYLFFAGRQDMLTKYALVAIIDCVVQYWDSR